VIAAIDCDLRKVYALRSDGALLYKAHPNPVGVAFEGCRTVLFEIASALDYTDNKAVAHQKRRWTIWNVACAQRLHSEMPRGVQMLVAPSSAWTKGFNLAQRHAIAACEQKQKDLRECEAMLSFYGRDVRPWVTLPMFLECI
jgi:hypothetical protein